MCAAAATDDIEPPPTFGTGIHADFVSGMARRENDFVIVLNIDRTLSSADVVDLAHAKVRADGSGRRGLQDLTDSEPAIPKLSGL